MPMPSGSPPQTPCRSAMYEEAIAEAGRRFSLAQSLQVGGNAQPTLWLSGLTVVTFFFMYRHTTIFSVLALAAAIVGFGGAMEQLASVARMLFPILLAVAAVSAALGRADRKDLS